MVYTFALVIILFAPDLSGYRQFVGVFPDRATCEADRKEKRAEADALGFRHAIDCIEMQGGPAA